MEKVVRKFKLGDPAADKADVDYWLSRMPDERIAEVERLRREHYGERYTQHIKLVGRVLRLKPGGGYEVVRVLTPKRL